MLIDEQYDSGFYVLREPIPFDGTIVHVTASGYCASRNREDQLFRMILVVFDESTMNTRSEYVPVTCNIYSNITVGTVDEYVNLAVLEGEYLVISFDSQCTKEPPSTCPFRPAIISESGQFSYFNGSMTNISERIPTAPQVGLQFSFTIKGGETVDCL